MGVNKGNGKNIPLPTAKVCIYSIPRAPPVLTMCLLGNPRSSWIDIIGDSGYVTIWSEGVMILGKLGCFQYTSQTPWDTSLQRGHW